MTAMNALAGIALIGALTARRRPFTQATRYLDMLRFFWQW
jgi:hypothetical protein